MQQAGVLVTGAGGCRVWFPCPEPEKVGPVLAAAKAAGHHLLLADPGTRVEYGTTDGRTFTAAHVIQEGRSRVPQAPVPPARPPA